MKKKIWIVPAVCVALVFLTLLIPWMHLTQPESVPAVTRYSGLTMLFWNNAFGIGPWFLIGTAVTLLFGAVWIVLSILKIRNAELAGAVFAVSAIVFPALLLKSFIPQTEDRITQLTLAPYVTILLGAIALILALGLLFGRLRLGDRIPVSLHIAKRDGIPAWKRWLFRTAAILIALLLCAIITILITKMNPASVFSSMIKGTFGSARKTWKTIYYVVILLGISLAVTPAFKMRFWNIGAEGQVLIGAFAAAACMFYAGRMPFFQNPDISMSVKNLILFPCMVIASLAAGALWGFLPAFFKSRWNTNETLFTLMMNYVAIQIVKFMIAYREFPKLYQWSSNGTSVGTINAGFSSVGIGTFQKIGEQSGTQYWFPIVCIAVLTVLMFLYLRYSKQGYEISVVGESERTASYAGIKVDRVIIRTMILSGALCGLVGFLLVAAEGTVSHDVVDGRGYTAVMVSWMSQFNPFGMVFSSLLLVFMQFGAKEVVMPDGVSLDKNFANMLMAIILFFIIGCEFFITYKLQLGRHKKKEE